MRKTKVIFFLMIVVSFLTVLVFIHNRYDYLEKRNSDFYEISVICRGKNMESYSSVKAGIDQAADDLNAEVNYITLTKDNDAAQQLSLLKQEISNGTNAVVIIPAENVKDGSVLRDAAREVPLVALKYPIGDVSYATAISCDEYRLGSELAKKIISDKGPAGSGRFQIIRRSSQGGGTRLLEGVTDALKNGGATDITCSAAADSYKKVYDDVKQSMGKNEGRIFVALDGDSLEVAGKAKKDLLKSGEASDESIYGVGRTDANVAMLGDGIIQAIGAEDEYSMGYLGIKIAIDGIQKKYNENDITVNFIVSDKSNMHYPKNEYILFPFINY